MYQLPLSRDTITVTSFNCPSSTCHIDNRRTNRSRRRGMVVKREKDSSGFLVPENIISPRRRRELRIFMSFNPRTRNWKVTEGDPSFCNKNNIKNSVILKSDQAS